MGFNRHDAGKGAYRPFANDWIGVYCGDNFSNVPDMGFLDWQYSMLRNSASGPEGWKVSKLFRPDSSWESPKIGPPAGPIWRFSLLESSRNPALKPDSRPRSTFVQHKVRDG